MVVIGLVAFVGTTTTAGANARRAAAVQCPAPGETLDDAVSTAPARHSPEELAAIRKVIEAELPGPKGSPDGYSIGDGRDTVDVTLAPGREAFAASIVRRFGDAVRIHVGPFLYVPRGCGAQPVPQPCPDLVGDAPSTAGLRLKVIADTPHIRVSQTGRARLEVRNVGTTDFSIDSGIPIRGSLVRPGTEHVVGVYAGGIAGVGGGVRLAPGETDTIDAFFGAARCDGGPGSALPPGRYGLRIVLTPEGPPDAVLSPRLLSPQTMVTVTK